MRVEKGLVVKTSLKNNVLTLSYKTTQNGYIITKNFDMRYSNPVLLDFQSGDKFSFFYPSLPHECHYPNVIYHNGKLNYSLKDEKVREEDIQTMSFIKNNSYLHAIKNTIKETVYSRDSLPALNIAALLAIAAISLLTVSTFIFFMTMFVITVLLLSHFDYCTVKEGLKLNKVFNDILFNQTTNKRLTDEDKKHLNSHSSIILDGNKTKLIIVQDILDKAKTVKDAKSQIEKIIA